MTDKEKAIVTAYTGITMLTGAKLGIFYEYVEGLLGRPIFTHELADKDVWDQIKEKSKPDFIELCREEADKSQGEWIIVSRNCWKCPFCQELTNEGKNFCPNCGASMKKGGAE